ncbi:AscBF operon repressor [Enterobacter bugandensis]|uniref:AscBF operon repressor n=1 Tax=Enterobacter bugandensis TaxID=881260 RepID=A0A822WMD8_9ENTR|nr:AscBF operon repressor [Enterobacter bugandensis]
MYIMLNKNIAVPQEVSLLSLEDSPLATQFVCKTH